MPRPKKSEREAFDRLTKYVEGSAAVAKLPVWEWLDGMTTSRIWRMYDGEASCKSVTTRLIRYIGKDYIDTEVCRENGKVCRRYKCKKHS